MSEWCRVVQGEAKRTVNRRLIHQSAGLALEIVELCADEFILADVVDLGCEDIEPVSSEFRRGEKGSKRCTRSQSLPKQTLFLSSSPTRHVSALTTYSPIDELSMRKACDLAA